MEWAALRRSKLFWKFAGAEGMTCLLFCLLFAVGVLYDVEESCEPDSIDTVGVVCLVLMLLGAMVLAGYWVYASKHGENVGVSKSFGKNPVLSKSTGTDRMYLIMLLVDRLATAAALVLLSSWPIIQALAMFAKQCALLVMLIATSPRGSSFVYRLAIGTAGARTIVLFLMLLLAPGVLPIDTRFEVYEAIGWAIATMHTLMMLCLLGMLLLKIKSVGDWLAETLCCCLVREAPASKETRIKTARALQAQERTKTKADSWGTSLASVFGPPNDSIAHTSSHNPLFSRLRSPNGSAID